MAHSAICRTLMMLLLPTLALAQQSDIGAGPFVGSALGISGKSWVNDNYALAAGLGVSVEGDNAMHLHADYLIHSTEAPQRLAFFRDMGGDGTVIAYYGLGARLKLIDSNRLGARATVGLAYAAGAAPWDLYLEAVQVLDVIPDSDWDTTAFLGWRWYVDGQRRQPATPSFRRDRW